MFAAAFGWMATLTADQPGSPAATRVPTRRQTRLAMSGRWTMSPVAVAAAGGAVAGGGVLLLVRQLRPARIPLTVALQRLQQPAPPTASRAKRSPPGRWGGPAGSSGWAAGSPAATWAGRYQRRIWRCWRWTRRDVLPPENRDGHLRAAAARADRRRGDRLTGISVAPILPAGLGSSWPPDSFFAPDLVVAGQARKPGKHFRRRSAPTWTWSRWNAPPTVPPPKPSPAPRLSPTAGPSAGSAKRWTGPGSPAPHPGKPSPPSPTRSGSTTCGDLADILAVAGDDGAAVYDALTAKAASLRSQQLAAAKAAANTASEKLTLPGVLLCFGFLLLVCYPGIARVLGL